MATQNDFNMVWMNQGQMMLPDDSLHSQLPSDMLGMDHNSAMDSSYYPTQVPAPFDSVSQQPMELDGFLMMDEYDGDFCDGPPRFITASTQTLPNLRKKIYPVKHPGLKLQSPISYKCDSDPNVIPIEKNGLATCEKCGSYGVRHSFYTRLRKYCSTTCARAVSDEQMKDKLSDDDSMQSQNNYSIYKFSDENEIKSEELVTNDILPLPTGTVIPPFNGEQKMALFPFTNIDLTDETVIPTPIVRPLKEETYDWLGKLNDSTFVAAPVQCFKHAPMADSWDNVVVGMKVEVETTDYKSDNRLQGFSDSFWVATVMRIAGYKALLRYEGCVVGRDFWVNLCSCNVHPVGWCATRGKPLIPPKCIAEDRIDWKEFLVKTLTGARTLPSNFHTKVSESMKPRFRVGLRLEVVNKDRLCEMCVAMVTRITGKRLHVSYSNDTYVGEFWCHEDSPLIHPVGWSYRVGHLINATQDYREAAEQGIIDKDDASEELFTGPFQSVTDWKGPSFATGMKLEAIDPLNLSTICAATVTEVLNDGYLMIRIDSYAETDGSDSFCYHSSSPCIFPPGFCRSNGISLVPPINHSGDTFTWNDYEDATGCNLAPPELFQIDIPAHGLTDQMSLECTDLMEPRLMCVATIRRVVGRLLKVHFDGWEEEFDQWMDCSSPDFYPVGWCNLVSHKLEAPPTPLKQVDVVEKKKGGRRRKNRLKPVNNKKQTQVCAETLNVNKGDTPSSTSAINACQNKTNESPKCEFAHSSGNALKYNQNEVSPRHFAEVSSITASLNADSLNISSQSNSSSTVPSFSNKTNTFIPKLADSSTSRDSELDPCLWTCMDVISFLKINDCGVYADNFLAQQKNGSQLLALTQDEIMGITGKTGPALKIFALIQQLKARAKASKRFNF